MAGFMKRENIIETFLSNESHSSPQAAKGSRYPTSEYLCVALRRHNAHHCTALYAGLVLDISGNCFRTLRVLYE